MANRVTKDKVVRDGFNRKKTGARISREEERRLARTAMMEKKRLEAEKTRHEKEAAKLAEKLANTPVADEGDGEVVEKEEGKRDSGLDGIRENTGMLRDMRAVYKKLGGKKKLEDLMEEDEKQFLFMVKELMKIESALLTARIRAKEDAMGQGGNQTVFVVLKGLDDEKKVEDMTQGKGPVDLRQINHVLNPDGTEYEQ